jgi:type IV secretion system protein VirB2
MAAAQCLLLLGLLALSTTAAVAATAGGGMPWEGPLNQLLTSLSGPVARVIGGVAFSEGGSTMRKALWVVVGLALAFNALTWGLSFLGFSGGLVV